MDLSTILGLAGTALGLAPDAARFIKDKLSKKIRVTPNVVETTSRHWDSTNSVIVQNKTNGPIFSLQIVFWHESNQKLEFKLDQVKKEAEIEGLVINYGVVIYRGEVSGEKVAIVELLRLMPNESIEIDLQIEKPGTVKIFPATFDEKRSKQVLNDKKEFAYPFSPPFEMTLASIGLFLRKKD
ncbi:MAG TPA: hypothetical protein VLG16_05200 [Candidatus Saccharimonadales bacterium]|nr:hypothetical protein [Candidatus Saccharimonadales bacterium]